MRFERVRARALTLSRHLLQHLINLNAKRQYLFAGSVQIVAIIVDVTLH